ncbi:MAG: 50S ribosomal protein L5 [Firmicutes bacterium]|nr:50S ribosomal protein L5 [Bacillota bacterium]
MARLQEKYEAEIKGQLQEKFQYENVMQIPRLHKVVINMGLGEAIQNPKALDAALADLTAISGQKPIVTKAKKSIAAFKVRQGMNIGCKVTLRGQRMYEFVDRLISAAIPRVRDFKGVSAKAFDGRGNYTLGLKEQLIFPEIDYDKIDRIRGMEVCFVTSAKTDEECKELLRLMGMPFADKNDK